MLKEESRDKTTGIIMLVLSILFLMWTLPLLLLSGGSVILEQGLKLAGSSLAIGDIDKAARGYLNMAMLKPLWEEKLIILWCLMFEDSLLLLMFLSSAAGVQTGRLQLLLNLFKWILKKTE